MPHKEVNLGLPVFLAHSGMRILKLALAAIAVLVPSTYVAAAATPADARFEIFLPANTSRQPVTGRLLLIFSRTNEPEVRLQASWVSSPPVFGVDVNKFKPGQVAVIDGAVAGYPLRSLAGVPPGDYYVQALLNVYTEFHRADGHVIWAHMDQWEGQQFNRSSGNLYSPVKRVHLDAAHPCHISLSLTETIPPVQVPPDTEWVKHIRIRSELLTRFWGQPMYLGAVVLLPRDYASHSDAYYPVIYQQGHFSHEAPFDFRTSNDGEDEIERLWRQQSGVESGYEFYEAWKSDHFPRVVAATFLHPTPYYDDSYAVDSVNNGPYGTAIMTELIPYIEKTFRIIRKPYARVLTGGSTGGWEALALQLQHPSFFGGTWSFYPDSIDFRRLNLVNIYEDDNSYVFDSSRALPWLRQEWVTTERPLERNEEGQPLATVRQASQAEAVLFGRARSGGAFNNQEAVYGPVGEDGYPKPLWDRATGKIDHTVALYMRDHGYDLRYYAETHWHTIGPPLIGKLHLYCGDMDNLYLNLSVYLFQQFLQGSTNPHYAGSFEYGRPGKGHGWQPMTNAQLVKQMAEQITGSAPAEMALNSMHY